MNASPLRSEDIRRGKQQLMLRQRDVGATKSTTSRGMQPRVVERRVEADYPVGVG